MKKIASFSVDHNRLNPGVYISRTDGDIVTYDLRFIKPNTPPFLEGRAMHTIEHLFATYARNSHIAGSVIYFGPMGCRTGFYLLLRSVAHSQALDFIKEITQKCAEHRGEIPGSAKEECGNYLEHNLPGATAALQDFHEVIKPLRESDLNY
ncbi:MAG: S-ribosylhomocysteine lyase [Oscillospiraceae bacterium]|jgi:S-ribosylhomocysteine lyase|nr:S-ribosylhomocysteine lyase [Oscillospiraceae bacterium]